MAIERARRSRSRHAIPDPPDHLPEDLRSIWVEMATEVKLDGPGLEALCTQICRMREARQRINAEGLVVADVKGNPIPHPCISIEQKANAEVRIWLKEFKRHS